MVGEAVRGLARIDIVGTNAGTNASATASMVSGARAASAARAARVPGEAVNPVGSALPELLSFQEDKYVSK